MGFISALTEFAAAAANLHPDHRSRLDELAGVEHPRSPTGSPVRHGDTPEETASARRVG